MAYDSTSILPLVPALWTLNKASMTTAGELNLEANGKASFNFTTNELSGIKESFLLRAITDLPEGTNMGSIDSYILIAAHSAEGLKYSKMVPLYNGATETVLVFEEDLYTYFNFSVYSNVPCIISTLTMHIEQASDISAIIAGVSKEMPKLLADYNPGALTVGTSEVVIAQITAEVTAATDLQGHLSIACTAPLNTIATIRIYNNDVQELYTPLVRSLSRGYNSIGIPHAYLKCTQGIHNFIVTMQVAKPISIRPRGVLYTIDGGYLLAHVTDVGFNLVDLTFKRTSIDTSDPTEIYAISIDNGVVSTKSRVYDAPVGAAWTTHTVVGEGIAAAIEFNGHWERPFGAELYGLVTDELPHIFYVNKAGSLICKSSTDGDSYNTAFELATGVTGVAACRGWKSTIDLDKDQGLICAYIREGKAYYRCYEEHVLGAFRWSTEATLTSDPRTVIKLSTTRLNDYRTLFTVTFTDKETIAVYSARTFIGHGGSVDSTYASYNIKQDNASLTLSPVTYNTHNITEENAIGTFKLDTSRVSFLAIQNATTISPIELLTCEKDEVAGTFTLTFAQRIKLNTPDIKGLTIVGSNSATPIDYSITGVDTHSLVLTVAPGVTITGTALYTIKYVPIQVNAMTLIYEVQDNDYVSATIFEAIVSPTVYVDTPSESVVAKVSGVSLTPYAVNYDTVINESEQNTSFGTFNLDRSNVLFTLTQVGTTPV